MKKFVSSLLVVLVFSFSLFCFTGCTHKTYHLKGVVDPQTSTVTPISEVDSETREYIHDNFGTNPTIRLKANGELIFAYTITEPGLEVNYTHTGTYSINKEERIITFSFPKTDGSGTNEVPHQFEDGKIVYFDGVNFLLFN